MGCVGSGEDAWRCVLFVLIDNQGFSGRRASKDPRAGSVSLNVA